MVIVQKRYLPFVENWDGASEYPRKQHESNHVGCIFYTEIDGVKGRCTRRDVVVIKTQLHCKGFQERSIQFVTGNVALMSIGMPKIN